MDIPKSLTVLEEFKRIPKNSPRHQTFLEISGYPHRETVYSNIFSFFFDSEECHGLGNLFLRSLLNILNIDGSNERSCGVEPEKTTGDGKRIDIVIETNSYLIGIENKVFHDVNNPFASYETYLDEHSKNCEVLKVILCLNDNGVRDVSEKNLYGFIPITYEQFFNEIKKNIGDCLIQAQPKYLTMLSDFIETIENIGKGSSMDKVFLDFIKKQAKPIEELICELDKFRNELKQKVQSLGSEIETYENVSQWYWRENKNSLFYILVHDITLSESNIISTDTCIDINGWSIFFGNRKGGSMDELKNLLLSAEIDVTVNKEGRYEYVKKYDYEGEKQDDLCNVLQNIIKKLSSKAS